MAGKFESVEKCLEKHVPEDELKEVKRILYGKPCRYKAPFMIHDTRACMVPNYYHVIAISIPYHTIPYQ